VRRAVPALLALGLAACVPGAPPSPHYVLGQPYQAGGVWWYPRAALRVDETGLATVADDDHPALTANGEAFDQTAMAAANQTLPLPCIARVTNLETGRQVLVRINDRGPPTPLRLLAVTRRVATLLGFPSGGVARIRLEVLERESQEAEAAAAPRGAVAATSLPPPPGARGTTGVVAPTVTLAAAPAERQVPLRLPETATQVRPDPGTLWIDLGSFPAYDYANIQRAAVAQLGAQVVSVVDGRTESFQVRIGPIPDIAQADRLLDETLALGVPDGRIVVR